MSTQFIGIYCTLALKVEIRHTCEIYVIIDSFIVVTLRQELLALDVEQVNPKLVMIPLLLPSGC